jgi:hypothetical protein
LHNCAYIELYLGSSRAFSKICNTKRIVFQQNTDYSILVCW